MERELHGFGVSRARGVGWDGSPPLTKVFTRVLDC
jgi:hypothetical protein